MGSNRMSWDLMGDSMGICSDFGELSWLRSPVGWLTVGFCWSISLCQMVVVASISSTEDLYLDALTKTTARTDVG